MALYRTRRKLAILWRNHPSLDLAGALPGVLGVLLPRDPGAEALQSGFLAASATVISVLVAVVTFACAFIYQAQNPAIESFRQQYVEELRDIWLWCVVGILTATMVTLGALLVGYWFMWLAWCLGLGALCFAVAVTLRALDLLRWALGER